MVEIDLATHVKQNYYNNKCQEDKKVKSSNRIESVSDLIRLKVGIHWILIFWIMISSWHDI